MYFHYEKRESAISAKDGHALMPLPHIHSHIEIVYVSDGETNAVADDKEATAKAGDLFISFPNQIHYYNDVIRPVYHKILIMSPDVFPEFNRIFKSFVPQSPVLKNAGENKVIMTAIDNIYECVKEDDDYSEASIRGNMLVLLSELFRNMPLERNAACDTNLAKDIISYCYENYSGNISLQSIADGLHISRCYISHLFSKRLHTGFSEYINTLRVQNACGMLKTDEKTITEIAYAVGYNSSRTFNRSFIKIKGMTPKEYRTQNLKRVK